MSKEHADNLAEALRFLIISYMDSGIVSKTEMENVLEDVLQYIQRRNTELLQENYRTDWK